MKLMLTGLAAALTVATLALPAAGMAQGMAHDGMQHSDMQRGDHHGGRDKHWNNGHHNGWNNHHRQCRTVWRHHHRVRVCR